MPVVSIDSNGEITGYYESMRQAGEINGIDPCTISNAVRMKKWCKKRLWMLESEYRIYWFEGRTDELRNSYRQHKRDSQQKRFVAMGEDGVREWKKKHSENRKTYLKLHPDNIVRPRKPVLCITTGKEFPSASDMAREYGLDASNVCRAARSGGRVGGMVVKYLD